MLDLARRGDISLRELRLRLQKLTGTDLAARKDDIKRMAEISMLTLAQDSWHASPPGNSCCIDMLSQDSDSVDRGRELFLSLSDISDETCRLMAAVQCGVWEPFPDRTLGGTSVVIETLGLKDCGRVHFLSVGDDRDCGASAMFTSARNSVVDEPLVGGMEAFRVQALLASLAFSKTSRAQPSCFSVGPAEHMGEITAELVQDGLVVLEHSDGTTVHDSAALNDDFPKNCELPVAAQLRVSFNGEFVVGVG